MLRTAFIAATLAVTGLLLSACAKKPEVVYEPPLTMSDLADGLPAPDNNYLLLADEPTTGRFACALAVAKLAQHDGTGDYELKFVPLRPEEQAYWAERFRGLGALREVSFLTTTSTRLNGDGFEGLCRAAERIRASLLLVYAPNGLGPNSAQVFGVLYDVPTREPIATFHSSAQFLDEEGVELSMDGRYGDHRDNDARYQATRAFEGHVLGCMRELVRLDTPPPTTQPHDRWQTPWMERWWLPVYPRR